MAGIQEKGRAKSLLSLTATALLAAVIACACQSASITKSASGKSEVKLSLRVLSIPALPKSGSSASKSISRLILPTSTTLAVSMTPEDSGLSTPSPQVVPISSGSTTVAVSFSDVDLGTYTISAVAMDSSGTAQCEGSSTVEVAGSTQDVTLNLLPTSFFTTVTGSPFSISTVMSAEQDLMYYIPTSWLLSNAGSMPAYAFELQVNTAPTGCEFVAEDENGNLLFVGFWMGTYFSVLDGTTWVEKGSLNTIGPSPMLAPVYLLIASPNAGSIDVSISDYYVS